MNVSILGEWKSENHCMIHSLCYIFIFIIQMQQRGAIGLMVSHNLQERIGAGLG
jgi:hypothetical protein